MAKQLMKGNVAIAEAAIRCGLNCFFGYPITPQNDIPEYLSENLPKYGGVFLQSESELAAVNMVEGAAATGARVMTSTSGPGFSLMQEGVSNIAAIGLPCVFVNVMRGGPGSGCIFSNQGDYFQATRGGGNGDYHVIVLAPSGVQEACDLVQDAFDLAEEYRMPAMLLADAMIGQMMEPVEIAYRMPKARDLSWATLGWDGKSRPRVAMASRNPTIDQNVERIRDIEARYARLVREQTRWEFETVPDAEAVIVAYGSVSRLVREAIEDLRAEDVHVELLRPITLVPFPYAAVRAAATRPSVKRILVVEMSTGQMVEDVRLGVNGIKPVKLFASYGSRIPMPEEIARFIQEALRDNSNASTEAKVE